MADVIELEQWKKAREEVDLSEKLNMFLELCNEVVQCYTPEEYVYYMSEQLDKHLKATPLDHETISCFLIILDVFKTCYPDYYFDMVITPDFEAKISIPLTKYITNHVMKQP